MRRALRLRQSRSLLAASAPNHAAYPQSLPTARTITTTSPKCIQPSQRLWKGEPTPTSTPPTSSTTASDLEAYEADLAELESHAPQPLPSDGKSKQPRRPPSRVRASYRRTRAPTANEAAVGYSPALSAEGLEEVGGFEGWWDQPGHWGPESEYVGFAPSSAERVTDPHVLEVLLRQAVLEGLAVRRERETNRFVDDWPAPDRAALDRAMALRLKVAEDGVVALRGNSNLVVKWLNPSKKAQKKLRAEEAAEGAATTPNVEVEGQEQQPAAEVAAEETAVEEAAYHTEAADGSAYYHSIISTEEAKELVGSWDPVWKDIALSDPQVKFAIRKRIFQLTGHLLPDAKLARIETVNQFLSILVGPPPAKKVVEAIERKGDLLQLPNVRVHSRRVTPIDKEIEVGRWKLIREQLEKRGLPLTGHKHLEPHREAAWVKGR
ncbi:hypothetical protein ACRALDRAFT_1079118 [Sodiomyces alcalophilus JCM 7366]|uniref:uncharacterized protein n=1 Tax=Sodiomyces alcalophilus JCM 7366 TaxID=591952 RepID=UPI0039B4E23F